MADEDLPEPGMAIKVGQIQIDVPRSLGYPGAVLTAESAQGTVRLIDPQEDAASDIQTAESARRGEALKATRSARAADATTPA